MEKEKKKEQPAGLRRRKDALIAAVGLGLVGAALLFYYEWYSETMFLAGLALLCVGLVRLFAGFACAGAARLAAYGVLLDVFSGIFFLFAFSSYRIFRRYDLLGILLFLAALVLPVAGVILGGTAFAGGARRFGAVLAVAAIALPVIAVATLILLVQTGVAVISLM